MENIELTEQEKEMFEIMEDLAAMSNNIESITVKLEGHEEGREGSLEDILFSRSCIDYLVDERMGSLEDIECLKTSIRLLVNECIESSLEYVGTDREEIEKLIHLLR